MTAYDDDPKLAEITWLNHQLTEMWALADDLYHTVVNYERLTEAERLAAAARYWEARQQ